MKTKYKPSVAQQANLIQRIAEHYLKSPEDVLSQTVKAQFRQFIHRRYRQVKKLGIREVRVKGQPYKNANELFFDFDKNHRIQVSTDFNDPVVLDPETNLEYRFAHDLDHCFLRVQFDFEGEQKACNYLSSLTQSDMMRRIIRSELLYQAAACIYLGDFPDTQKIVLSDPKL